MRMESLLLLLPCVNAAEQLRFYTSIGFDIIAVNRYNKKNQDILVAYKNIFLQFYTSKNLLVNENTGIKYLPADNIEQLYETFTSSLRINGQEIPRAGIPRITEIEGSEDGRHFTVVDPSGNTFIIKTEKGD